LSIAALCEINYIHLLADNTTRKPGKERNRNEEEIRQDWKEGKKGDEKNDVHE